MNITVHTADLSDIEELASDLAHLACVIQRVAVTHPETVTTLVKALEHGLDGLAVRLYALRG
jgi:hypothetical protein